MTTKLAFKSQEGKKKLLMRYDALLEKCITPFERSYVSTRYGDTFIMKSGAEDAPPLILLHGSAMNSVMWMRDIETYSKDYRVYAIDIPGEPGRSDERQLPFQGDDFAKWLLDVYDALGIEKARIVGISLGAWLAVKFAVHFPEKAEKLVLLCPAGIGPQKTSFLFRALFYGMLGEKGFFKLCKQVNGNQPMPEEILRYQKLINENFNYRREVIPLYSDEELKRLTMPVSLFVGGKDVMFHSDQTAKRLGNIVPHAKINMIPDAGHTLINLTDQISKFLQSEN